jgi:hypothetical protein
MRKSSKIVVTKITPSTKERIFSGYERNICNEVTSEFMEFLEKYKKYHVLNYRTAIDKNGIPYIDILVYE